MARQTPKGIALFCGSALLPEGWRDTIRIEIEDGLIARIVPSDKPSPGDESVAIALPGLGNLHSHAFQRGMAGLAERRGPAADSFWTWRELMYRFVGRIDPGQFEAIAAMAFLEMVEAGFTRVAEFHYLHHDRDGGAFADPAEMAGRAVAAAALTGIGLTLLPVFYAHSGFGGAPAGDAQARFLNDPDSYARLIEASRRAVSVLPGALVGIAPHSLRAVTPDELSAILPLAAGNPIHIHIAEQMREVEECLVWSGKRPVELLLQRFAVDRHWCLVHATHLLDSEMRDLAKSGAVAGLCPITEANLGDGLFPLEPFLRAGGQFGVGSDSNVLIDAAEELRLLEYGQRLAHRSRNVAASGPGQSTGGGIFRGALAGGAWALGVTGGLTIGASADVIGLAADHPAFIGREGDQLLDSLIFAGGAIDAVWCRGVRQVSGGVHRHRPAVEARYRKALTGLLE